MMKTPNRELQQKKAMLAIAFASSLLTSASPALADNKAEQLSPEIRTLLKEKRTNSRMRAISLLEYASKNLSEDTQTEVELQLNQMYYAELRNSRFKKDHQWDLLALPEWAAAAQIELRKKLKSASKEYSESPKSIDREKLILANQALQQALRQIANCDDGYSRLHLYFIASQLFRKSENVDGMKICDTAIEQAFRRCEDRHVSETEIDQSISVLNQMANSLIPTNISISNSETFSFQMTQNSSQCPSEITFTEEDFEKCERLKRRVIGIVDLLPAENHLRRRAHRDLVLWYRQLNKIEEAEREKNVLFDLVGIRDESILYPQSGTCGVSVWWQKHGTVPFFGCGMG